MKKIVWVLLVLLSVSETYAQNEVIVPENRSDYILSANLAGDLSILSFGFEKLFFLKPAFTLSAKVALGFNQEFNIFTTEEPPTNYFILPHHVTCNFGKNRSYLELGVGGAWVSSTLGAFYLVYPMLGYRYHPFKNPGFSFRAWLYYPFGKEFTAFSGEVMFVPVGLSFGIAL